MSVSHVLSLLVAAFAVVAGIVAAPAPVYLRLASIFAGIVLALVAFGVLV